MPTPSFCPCRRVMQRCSTALRSQAPLPRLHAGLDSRGAARSSLGVRKGGVGPVCGRRAVLGGDSRGNGCFRASQVSDELCLIIAASAPGVPAAQPRSGRLQTGRRKAARCRGPVPAEALVATGWGSILPPLPLPLAMPPPLFGGGQQSSRGCRRVSLWLLFFFSPVSFWSCCWC